MNIIRKHLADVEEAMTLLDIAEVERLALLISTVRSFRGTIYVFGNGGSHATASHLANDLIKMVRVRAICIGDMASAMMAYGNDTGWENMFFGPLTEMLRDGDGVIGISCGGSSPNVIKALKYATATDCVVGGLTGIGIDTPINKLKLDVLVHARVNDIRVQEDLHMIVCHAAVRMVQESD